MLIPAGGWITTGGNFEDVQFIEATPITKAQFEQGVLDYPAYVQAKKDALIAEEAAFQKDRADGLAKLEALGLTLAQAKAVARKDK